MPKFTLKYFNIRYLGEPARMLLNYVGEPFVDQRIAFREWPTIKPSKLYKKKLIIFIKKVLSNAIWHSSNFRA